MFENKFVDGLIIFQLFLLIIIFFHSRPLVSVSTLVKTILIYLVFCGVGLWQQPCLEYLSCTWPLAPPHPVIYPNFRGNTVLNQMSIVFMKGIPFVRCITLLCINYFHCRKGAKSISSYFLEYYFIREIIFDELLLCLFWYAWPRLRVVSPILVTFMLVILFYLCMLMPIILTSRVMTWFLFPQLKLLSVFLNCSIFSIMDTIDLLFCALGTRRSLFARYTIES